MVLIPALAGEWGSGSATKDDSSTDCDCLAVDGKVGALSAFATTNLTNGLKTTGTVGAEWKGKQFLVCSNPEGQVVHDNWVQHNYTRTTTGSFTRPLLKITATSTISETGSAKRWKTTSQQWWWDAAVSIVEKRVKAETFLPASSVWVGLPTVFDEDHDTQAQGSAADASNNNQPDFTSSFVAGNNTDGDTQATGLSFPQHTKVRVRSSWTTTAGPVSGDNCDVDEALRLEFTLETKWASP